MSATSQVPCSFISADALVVDEAAVLDGVDAGARAFLMPCGAVGVGGDRAAQPVRLLDGDLQLLEGELGRAGRVAAREDAAAGGELDHVDAVLDLGADDVADLVGAVGDPEVALGGNRLDVHVGRVVVQVAVAAGDADAGAGGDDARAGEKPSLIGSRRSTARNGAEPTSRTVVKPASSVRLACTTAASREESGEVLNFQMSS